MFPVSNIHVFLWLMFNNKSLTRDNLAKRRHVEDMTCVFCSELETIQHLFFDCIVAKKIWAIIAECFNIPIPVSFTSLSSFWKRKKHGEALNTATSATLWSLWLLRNDCLSGEKMAKYTLCFRSGGGDDQTMENSMYRGPGCSSSPVLKAFGSSKRGVA